METRGIIHSKNRPYILGIMLIISSFYLNGQLIFTEMMPSNTHSLVDQFGEFPDWIEIYNAGEESLFLGDFMLSDDITDLTKWTLPSINLPGNEYMLIFASGKDISDNVTYWHTLMNVGEEWKYFSPTSDIGDAWKESSEATSAWFTGKSGIGYSDNDDSTVIEQTITLYLQKEFTIEDKSILNNAALFMDYDDGFVAYLNGVEFARSSNMGDSGLYVMHSAPAGGSHEALLVNGLPAEGYPLDERMDLLKEGTNLLAIEVHNISKTSSDLTAIPFFMIGSNKIQDHLDYGNPYFVLRDRYPHSNFKIKASGEPLYLSHISGRIVDTISTVNVPADYSYGRIPGSATQYGFFESPTPGGPNSTSYAMEYFTDSVSFVMHGDPFNVLQKLKIESELSGDVIRYTLDGSDPDESSPVYSNVLSFPETAVVRARVYRNNNLPGPVSTKTVFAGRTHNLNIISVTTDPDNLWDYNNGIYVKGPNAGESSPYHGANFWQDWERPGHIELFDPSGNLLFHQDAGIKIFGGYSRAHPQKSLSFYARSQYGDGSFSYKLFSKKNIDKFETFIIRNDGNDWCNGMFRDALTAYIAEQIDVDHQAYEPVVHYLNGEYWGIINMREKINEHFAANNHYVYADEVNMLRGNKYPMSGTSDRYEELMDYVTSRDMSVYNQYKGVQKYLDLNYYARYWALNVYVNNKDWPANNIKFWATNAPTSQFRWVLFDTDFGLSIWDEEAYKVNTLLFALGEGDLHTWGNQPWATELMRSLVVSSNFREKLFNAFADGMNYYYHPDRMLPVIDSFEQRILEEAPFHFERWDRSFDDWRISVENMRTFITERPAYMMSHLMNRFNIAQTEQIIIDVNDTEGGNVKLNSILPDNYPFEGTYFWRIPIRVEAIPEPGYVFSHWEGDVVDDTTVINYHMKHSAYFKAVFEYAPDELPDIVINEINYESLKTRNTKDWVELYNNSKVPVDLSNWYLKDGFKKDHYDFPDGTIMQPGSYLLVNQSRPDFKMFHPESAPILGDMLIELEALSGGIALYNRDDVLQDFVIYKSSAPWPLAPNGSGATLELINPGLDNSLPGSWSSSDDGRGTPCAINSRFENIIIDVEETKIDIPDAMVYPSPFSEQTTIRYTVNNEAFVKVSVFSPSGGLISILEEGKQPEGEYRLTWTPDAAFGPGIYLIRIQNDTYSQTLKVIKN